MADAIVIPISKPFGRVPKHKADDNAIELPTKRSMARSFSINHDMLPESKPLLVSFGQVPKCKVEGDLPGPPPKKRAIKSPSTCCVMPQECCLWQLPNELLFDIVDLLSQVCKLLQDVSGHRYLATVGFKLPIDMQVVHKVYFHLYHNPSCIPPVFGSLLASIQNSGCTELHELVGPATALLSLLKLVMLPDNFRCLHIRFPPYYPEENALSSILSCTEYLPQLLSLEISMPMITSTDELAAFATFPTNDKCILPVQHLTFRGMHPVHSMPDVLDVISQCGPWLRAFPNVRVLHIATEYQNFNYSILVIPKFQLFRTCGDVNLAILLIGSSHEILGKSQTWG
ncbi:hypothetical protein EDC04DRAFT_2611321 [Pisolithus marmoratus]|nr:hypothetical protein EDC04DRAFT_2611321 [Pisolithus marmoratus]